MGLILLIFGNVMFSINSKNQNYVKIQATVSNVELTQEAYTDAEAKELIDYAKTLINGSALR